MTSRIASLISSQSLRGGAFLASARIRPIISPARWPSLTMFAADFRASSRLGVCPASQRKHALALLTSGRVSAGSERKRGVKLAPRFYLCFLYRVRLCRLLTLAGLPGLPRKLFTGCLHGSCLTSTARRRCEERSSWFAPYRVAGSLGFKQIAAAGRFYNRPCNILGLDLDFRSFCRIHLLDEKPHTLRHHRVNGYAVLLVLFENSGTR